MPVENKIDGSLEATSNELQKAAGVGALAAQLPITYDTNKDRRYMIALAQKKEKDKK